MRKDLPEKMLFTRSDDAMNMTFAYDAVNKYTLLDFADSPENDLVQAYASVIGEHSCPENEVFVPALGLNMPAFRGLLAVYFPRFIAPQPWLEDQQSELPDEGPLQEFPDLVKLLVENMAIHDEHHRCVAHLVATACMGNDHLWQDLGLPNRGALSKLLYSHFPKLASKNTGEMKWKKFFYKQLCEKEDIRVCKAPSCAVCDDYAKCFGPEV